MPALLVDRWYAEAAPAECPSRSLRSHNVENANNETKVFDPETGRPDRPNSYADADCYRGSFNNVGNDGLPPNVFPTFPEHPVISQLPAERFGHTTRPRTASSDFPVVPTRPPLRPTISFGGVSTYSYYSTTSSMLNQKSKAVAMEEEAEEETSLCAKLSAFFTTLCICLS